MDINAIYKKYGVTEFDPKSVKLDLNSANPKGKTDRSWGSAASDTLMQLGKGSGALVQTVGDIAQLATGSPNQNFIQDLGQGAIKYYDDRISPELKAKEAAAKKAINQQNGEIAQAIEAIKQYGSSPALLGGVAVESVPSLIVGGAGGRMVGAGARMLGAGEAGVTRASIGGAMATESTLEGGNSGGEVLRALNARNDLTDRQKMDRARNAALTTAIASSATYAIPGSKTIERSMMGMGNGVTGRTASALKGFGGEAAQEGLQSGTSQMAQNYYTDKPIMQGVGVQTGVGALTGGVMGGAFGLIGGNEHIPQQDQDAFNAHVGGIMSTWAKGQEKTALPHTPIDTENPGEIISAERIGNTKGQEDQRLLGAPGDRPALPYNDQKLIGHNGSIIAGYRGWSEPLGNRIQEAIDSSQGNDLHDQINGIINTEVSNRSTALLLGWAQDQEGNARSESEAAAAKVQQMISSGADRNMAMSAIDNMITPTREDITLSNLLNDGAPLPSRMSGLRLIPMLEKSIEVSANSPQIARTNNEFYDVLISHGMNKNLAGVMTNAYAAKDPQILRDHIYQTMIQNSPALIDHDSIRQNVEGYAGGVLSMNEQAIKAQNDSNEIANTENKLDSIIARFEFKPSKEKDGSVHFIYDGHEYFANLHGALGKVSFLEDGRKWHTPADLGDKLGLSYKESVELADRIYKMRGKEVDNTPIITQAERDANSEKIFLEYANKSQRYKGEDINLSKAFRDFWSPVKPQSIEMFMKYVDKNKAKYANEVANEKQTDSKSKAKPANNPQAERIKAAAEIPVGGSEEDAARAVAGMFQKQPDSQYKKMSAADREAYDQYYANAPEDLVGEAIRATNEVYGNDVGSANMALIDARAKAMGMSTDDFMQQYGITINNRTDIDGAQHIKDMEEADGLFQKDPVKKEKRGIYNVQYNGKNSTSVLKDILTVDNAIKFERGYESERTGRGYGASHIEKHIGPDQDGWVSKEELMNIGEAVRNVEPYIKDGKRVYEYHNNFGDRFRLIVGDRNGNENVVSFYSNRKAGDGNNTQTYIYTSPSENNSLHQKNPEVNLSESEINGMVEFGFKSTGEMRSAITLFKSADVSTLPHELMHVFERTLSQEERAAFDEAFKEHKEGEARSEAAAQGFETYLSEGKAPTKELEPIFEKFKNWLRDLWEMIFISGENPVKITDQQRAFYRAMMGDKEAIKEVFNSKEVANKKQNDSKIDTAAAKLYEAMPESETITKGENTQGTLFGAEDGVIVQPKLFSDKTEVDTLKVPKDIKATPQEYRTTIREMAKGEEITHPDIADQIKRSRSYKEAQEDAIVKTPSLIEEEVPTSTLLDDVGEKIGGARKDVWKERGLLISDLESMTASEQSKYATKEYVLGKPDYEKLATDGVPVEKIALYKIMRDRTAGKPSIDNETGIRNYVEAMGVLKGVFNDFLNGKFEAGEISNEMMKRVGYDPSKMPRGYSAQIPEDMKIARDKIWAIYKGRYSPLTISYSDKQKIKEMISKGFPSIEPFRRYYDLLVLRPDDQGGFIYGIHDHVKGYRRAIKDADGKVLEFTTKEAAFAKAKELYAERVKKGENMKPPLPVRPHLDYVKRVGDDVRGGKSVGADDFMKQYGFRGVEFGNWAAKDERQKVIDHAYDALSDLAKTLNLPDKALSLNGKLAMAFGARGKGGALAHYEPDYVVINMTKMKGAGALAHEWGHALDHYFGELERSDTNKVKARGASGWIDTTTVDRSNMRAEMKQAFADVMGAIFQSDGAKAEVIRDYELRLELPNLPKSREEYLRKRLDELRNADFIEGSKNTSNYYKEAEGLDSGSKKVYWRMPTELFARAFEAYVYDKLQTNGKRSDYLVQGVDERLFADGFRGNPYPAGLERQAINNAFDNLFRVIKHESMEDGNVRLYQRKKVSEAIQKISEEC